MLKKEIKRTTGCREKEREREKENVNGKNKAREKKKKKKKRDRKHVPSLHNEINADVAR